MTQYLQEEFIFGGRDSYNRNEMDVELNKKANLAQVFSRKEVLDQIASVDSNIISLSAQFNKLKSDILSNNLSITYSGTDLDGDTVNILTRRNSLEHERPVPTNTELGELVLSLHPNSSFIYAKDSSGVIRRLSGIQFGTSLPNGTAYSQSNTSTYPEQRTKGELFYHTSTSSLYLFDGTSWVQLSSGISTLVTEAGLASSCESLVQLENLSNVDTNGAKVSGDCLTWNGTKYIAAPPSVKSVAGKTGTVSLVSTDIDDTASTAKRFITLTLLNKLSGIETGATADQTPTEIRDAISSLTGTNRLDATSIKNLPSFGVTSFNGSTGVLTINTSNIPDTTAKHYLSSVITTDNQIPIYKPSGVGRSSITAPVQATGDQTLGYESSTNTVKWVKNNTSSIIVFTISTSSYTIVKEFSFLDGGGSDRNIILPSTPAAGDKYRIKNTGSTNNLILTALSLNILPSETLKIIWSGSSWLTYI